MPLANTPELASEVLRRLRGAATVVYDVETSGLDCFKNYPTGHVLTFGPRDEDSFFVPLRFQGGGNLPVGEERFDTAEHAWTPAPFEIEMWKLLRGKRIVFHNGAFDLGFMPGLDTTQCKFADTMIAAYLTNELRDNFHLAGCCADEKVQAKKGEELYSYLAQVLGVPNRKASMGEYWRVCASDPVCWQYATGDGTSTQQLWETLLRQIEEQDLVKVHQLESDLIPVLHRCRMAGVKVDREQMQKVIEDTERRYELASAAVGKINVRSSKEVTNYLADHGINEWPRTEKGAPNFGERWLSTNEPGRKVVAVRKFRTMLDSFLHPLRDTHLRGDRVHPQFHATRSESEFGKKSGTVTARMACTEPNLQQAPGKRQGERGQFFRTMFVPDHGQWFEADFAACELRIGAHYSKARLWVNGFANGIDPHTAVATALGIPRPLAKVISLGTLMGMGSKRLAEELQLPVGEGAAVLERYFAGLPEVRRLQQQAARVFESRGFVRTISGRKLRLEDPKKAFTAVNRLTQGGNADLVKSRMVEMDAVARSHPDTRLLFSVHDAINWETSSETADTELRRVMIGDERSGIKFSIPMEIEVGCGSNWGEASC